MFEIGRMCVKIAGRDAGLKCVIVDIIDDNFVLIDGQTRRRKCNVKHLEPLKGVVKLKKKATHIDVVAEFKKLKIIIKETKPKKATEKPKKLKKKKVVTSDDNSDVAVKAVSELKKEKVSEKKKPKK